MMKARDGNNRNYTFFGYNGNYPYLQVNALKKRGCWKFLDYKAQVAQVEKNNEKNRMRSASKRRIYDSGQGCNVDASVIDKCHFIWRPCNFYESVQYRIDKRGVRLSHNEENPLIYNHFETTKCIGTKHGLIRSLR